jgi:hypothetical protein
VSSTSGTFTPAPVPAKGGRPKPKGWRVPVLAVGLTPEPWWLRRLPNASSPCGLGFFHEVGAKLLEEIGPEGGRRHNSPRVSSLLRRGKWPKDPLGERRRDLVTNSTSANPATATF